MLVRGDRSAKYHDDTLQECIRKWTEEGVRVSAKCPGGGRIERNDDEKTIKIYGYSVGYGKPDHSITQSILQGLFPDYDITWSDDGY